MAKDGWGHVVLMAALTYTDDTALLRKVIIPDLLASPSPPQNVPKSSSQQHLDSMLRTPRSPPLAGRARVQHASTGAQTFAWRR